MILFHLILICGIIWLIPIVANVIATFKMIQKPPKSQQKLDSFVQQRET